MKIRKNKEFWICLDSAYHFDPEKRGNSEVIWSEEDLEDFCKNESHPKRYVKVKVVESKAPWTKHKE